MSNYKHRQTGEIISSSTYYDLPFNEKSNYDEVNDIGDFLNSVALGAATDDATLGSLGGSFIGGIVGDLLDGDLLD